MYKDVSVLMRAEIVKRFIPAAWVSIMEVKHQYYKALAHHNTAVALVDHAGKLYKKFIKHCNNERLKKALLFV